MQSSRRSTHSMNRETSRPASPRWRRNWPRWTPKTTAARRSVCASNEKGVAQAVLTRNPEGACRYVLAQIDLSPATRPEDRLQAIHQAFDEWHERGRDKGLNFDLQVAIALANAMSDTAETADQRGLSQNNLGSALTVPW